MILDAIVNALYALIEFLGSLKVRPIEKGEADPSAASGRA